jgi:hypothetical protein
MHLIGSPVNARHARLRHNSAPMFAHNGGQSLADLTVIHDARFGNVNRLDTSDVRFEFNEPITADQFACNTIPPTPFEDPLKGRQFAILNRDNDLAAHVIRHAVQLAEGFHGPLALAAIHGL